MDWKTIAGPLAQVGATTLGTIIGGPLGAAVGGVVGKAAADALGVEATPGAVIQAIERDPDEASVRLDELQRDRADEFAALEAEGMKLMQQLAESEAGGSAFSWAWRPTLSWLVALVAFQSFVLAPWLRGLFGLDVGIPYEQVLGFSGIWLTIYGGGHTFKAIFGKKVSG